MTLLLKALWCAGYIAAIVFLALITLCMVDGCIGKFRKIRRRLWNR